MGVYIPNVEMPRGCNSCPLVMEIDNTCSLTMGGCTKDKRPPHCPLIEIVTCGECKYYEESEYIKGDMVCKYHIRHTYYTEADRFCFYGERRTDETDR